MRRLIALLKTHPEIPTGITSTISKVLHNSIVRRTNSRPAAFSRETRSGHVSHGRATSALLSSSLIGPIWDLGVFKRWLVADRLSGPCGLCSRSGARTGWELYASGRHYTLKNVTTVRIFICTVFPVFEGNLDRIRKH